MTGRFLLCGLTDQCNCKIRFFYIIGLVLSLSSCGGYRTLEGRAKPVYFTADSTVFMDTSYSLHPIRYAVLAGLNGGGIETIELIEGVTSKVIISKPTLFYTDRNSEFLVFPGEHINVKGEDDRITFFAADGNKQRNRELLFLKKFQELRQQQHVQQQPSISFFRLGVTLNTILKIEKQQKDRILELENTYRFTFDSLIAVYDVRKRFKKLIENYAKNRHDFSLDYFYWYHRDTLLAHGIYFLKLREDIPVINGITKKADFNANIKQRLNDQLPYLFSGNLMWSFDDIGFTSCFDSVENNFTGIARDYLLSRLMYRAYAKGTKVPFDYEERYKSFSKDKTYRKIVRNTRKQYQQNERDNKEVPNQLLAVDAKTQVNLNTLLGRYKGKYVYMDLWASWCGPCFQEMPHLQQLIDKYSTKITFLAVSIDKQTFSWRDAIIKLNIQTWNNFLLLDAAKTSFYKQYKIDSIPRYLLFDTEGKVMYADVQSPSKPALKELLDKLVLE